ncbi:MAG: TonB-dependent receptor [Ferruginibacter sp.]
MKIIKKIVRKLLLTMFVCVLVQAALAQNVVKGVVTDSAGTALQGVSVTVKGKAKGTMTNAKGEYVLDADERETLEFSLIGYKKQSVKASAAAGIKLLPESTSLNDVVVVAYSTQKKVNLTGSVSSISADRLDDRPVTGVANALAGTMAGVTVVSNNGQPGKDAGRINIRGIGTLNNTDPMIVIDGVIATPNDMNAVNANDIENISVLKDAASASIYGSRAANGVILVTTKKGKKGTAQITYSTYFGKQSVTALPEYLPSWQAAQLFNQARINEGASAVYTDAQIDTFKRGLDPYRYPNTDWLGLFYNGSGFQQNHYLGVSGGNDKTQYLFSLGYFNQEGLVKKTSTDRYTVRMNINSKVKERITVNANLSYTYQPFSEPRSSLAADASFGQIIRQVNRISPIVPYKFANGAYGRISDGNPIAWVNSPSYNNQNAHTLLGLAGADIEIVKGLHLRPSLSYKMLQNSNKNFISAIQYYTADGSPSGQANISNSTDHYDRTMIITPQAILDYAVKINEHSIKALAGYSQEYTQYYELEGSRKNYLNNSLSNLNVAPADGASSAGRSYERAQRSYFGRVNYDYKNRYLLEANLRADASSIFAPENRWGYFPSASAGWRISQEDFFEPLKATISSLKLRGSWGRLGNQNIGANYPYIPTVSTGQSYSFGGNVYGGIAPVNGVNTDVTWETTTDKTFGLDAGFLNEKLTFTAEYFIRNTTGILYAVPISAPYGLNAPTQNTSSVQNKGWEFTAAYRDQKRGVSYNITANATFVKNKVTDLGPSSSPVISAAGITKPGLPLNALWGYVAEGIFQTEKEITDRNIVQNLGRPATPGDIIYKDISGPDGKPDGKIDGNDKAFLGSTFPKISFGLNIDVSWKNFDLTCFFQGTAGGKNIISGPILGQNGNAVGKPTSALLDSWTPGNVNAAFPKLWINYGQNDPSKTPSSFWVKNAGYVRLKNLQVGYSLPQKIAKKAHLQKLRLYYSGQNLFTATQFYKWVDPEAPSQTIGSVYPQVKVNTIGLNVTF